jgi:predicted permease
MSKFGAIGRIFQFRSLRRSGESEIDAEIRFHFDRTLDDLVRAGMTREEAEKEAQRRFGDLDRHKQDLERIGNRRARVERRADWAAIVVDNTRYALRGFRQSPVFTLTIVLTLALGIGGNAAMFSIIDRLMLSAPAHIEDPEGVLRLYRQEVSRGRLRYSSTWPHLDILDLRKSRAFRNIAAFTPASVRVGEGDSARSVPAALVSPDFFPLLGVEPLRGRFFSEADDESGAPGSVVLGYAYWQQELGGDPAALGSVLRIGDTSHRIVGIAPRGFSGVDPRRIDLWLPLHTSAIGIDPGEWEQNRGYYWLRTVARLTPGVSREAAGQEATALYRRIREADPPPFYEPDSTFVFTGPLSAARGPRASEESVVARWLTGVTLLVLLIACANVANLLLARGFRRRRQISIRLALGVSRLRLVGLLLCESVLISLVGGAVALLVAVWGVRFMCATLLPDLWWPGSVLSLRVLAYTFFAALLTGVLAGLIPALQASRPRLIECLKEGLRGVAHRRSKTRAALMIAQAAISVVLLVGAGLFLRSLYTLRSLDLGMDTANVWVVDPELGPDSKTPADLQSLYRGAAERLEALPDVERTGTVSSLPFLQRWSVPLVVPEVGSLADLDIPLPRLNEVTDDYFATVGMRIVRGRGFSAADREGSPPVIVINEALAEAVWPDEDAIGRCIRVGGEETPCASVVGLIENTRSGGVTRDQMPELFLPLAQRPEGEPVALFVHTRQGASDEVATVIRREVRAVSSDVRFVRVQPLQELIDPELRPWQLGATMFTLFGALALTIAAVGLYGVLAFSVAQRNFEIGVRSALGASRGSLVGLVMTEALRVTGIGVVIGLLIAGALSGWIEPLLYEVAGGDPLTFSVVPALLLVVALTAGVVPAWRATRVDPQLALRAE